MAEPELKRHQILNDISKQMSGLQLSDVFPIGGRKYMMTTLDLPEEQWVDSYTSFYSEKSGLETSAIRPMAVVAAAIKSIDDVPVAQLFEFPKEVTPELKQWTVNDQTMRNWYMNQMVYWLSDKQQGAGNSGRLVRELISAYQTLMARREASWVELKN